MTKLLLDPMRVLSAWEQMGGSAFSSDDAHLDDPDAFTLDLSSWEARLKPLNLPLTPQVETNIFASLFNPVEFGFPFLPTCCLQPAGASFLPEGPQVVPLCPSVLARCNDHHQNSDGACGIIDCVTMDETTQGSHMDEDMHMSIHFSDAEPAPSASPTSSEAGIVPDFEAGSGPQIALGQQMNAFTATSGSPSHTHSQSETQSRLNTSDAQGPSSSSPNLPLLPVLPVNMSVPCTALPSSIFVPVCQLHGDPPVAAAGCNGSVLCKQEPVNLLKVEGLEHQHQQPFAGSPPAAAPTMQQSMTSSSTTATTAGRQTATHQGQSWSGRAHGSSTATGQSQHQQPQQSGTPVYVRTRAECLERYRQKKARRLYTKKIRYQLRKINADKRPRIKGRFVKKEELAEFLAAQRCAGSAAAREEPTDPYYGFGAMDSDYD
ncbi:hypothetical protein Vretimale_11627 [Volvox reticuliferus]|uniref:CCT domain-containing protein n=1 Tax=Volvox reticuliferus TaxID=1737510 RepID=A0A8J4CPJ2_9CHLO|nr:hypothetical protein Vretifemale_14762 [Volvox reticuliferus]GIM07552.1 hypothetical protein Vretimale_11627 [Volvox reticuliferus]